MKNLHGKNTRPTRTEFPNGRRSSFAKRAVNKLIPAFALALGLFASPQSGSAALVAYYPFDTDALDYSGNGQGLTLAGSSTLSTSTKQLGLGAYDAHTESGSTSVRRAQRPDGPGNLFDRDYADFTVVIWARVQTAWVDNTNERRICGKDGIGSGGWDLRVSRGAGNANLIFQVADNSGNNHFMQGPSHASAVAGVFHMIVAKYHQVDATTGQWTTYWDGALDATETSTMTTLTGSDDSWFEIGNEGNSRTSGSAKSFLGYLDDASFWSEALSDQKIAGAYGLGQLVGVAMMDKYPSHAGIQIDEFVAAFLAQGSCIAGGYNWSYAPGIVPQPAGTITGSVAGGDAFIVLDSTTGDGMAIGAAVDMITLSTAIGGVNNIFENDADQNITLTVPANAVTASDVDVTITSSAPAVAIPAGAALDSVTIHFTQNGGSNTCPVAVHPVNGGVAVFTVSASTPSILAKNAIAVHTPQLVGHWTFSNDLTESSGYQPAGTHDGTAVGGNAGSFTFDTDVPFGFTGHSANMTPGDIGIQIANTSVNDSGYTNTFDDLIAYNTTIAFWAKGLPDAGDWNPWISKNGETDHPNTSSSVGVITRNQAWWDIGFQVRRNGGSDNASFTVRNTPDNDEQQGNVNVHDSKWHHYAAVRNGLTGSRLLYIDGVPDTGDTETADIGAMGLATLSHLVLGGRDKNDLNPPESLYNGKLYDVRIYNGALSSSQVMGLVSPTLGTLTPTAGAGSIIMNAGCTDTAQVKVYVPANLLVSGTATVTLSSSDPSVTLLTPVLHFATGQLNTSNVTIQAASAGGPATITPTSSDVTVVGSVTVIVLTRPAMIGRWASGPANLVDASGHLPGIHDGVVVGGTPVNLTFSSDVPAGFPGQSLALAGDVAVQVANTANTDGSYDATFDTTIANGMSVAFWAKGLPGGWNPWVTKRGEDGIGWQVREHGDGPNGCFTIRNGGTEDPRGSIDISSADSTWTHFAAVWNSALGRRQLYVNGVLDPGVNLSDDNAAYSQAPDYHMVIGARETGDHSGIEGQFTGKLYDVRVYDNALSQTAVQQLLVPPPTLTIVPWTGGQVRISWPVTSTCYTLQKTVALPGGWGSAGLTVGVEGSDNAAYAPASASAEFYRLVK